MVNLVEEDVEDTEEAELYETRRTIGNRSESATACQLALSDSAHEIFNHSLLVCLAARQAGRLYLTAFRGLSGRSDVRGPGENLSPKVISTFRLRFAGIKFRLDIGLLKCFGTVKGNILEFNGYSC